MLCFEVRNFIFLCNKTTQSLTGLETKGIVSSVTGFYKVGSIIKKKKKQGKSPCHRGWPNM
jgi:hypothetical protein